MNVISPPTWEWRTFAPEFEPIAVDFPPAFEAIDETFIVCPESDTRAVIRDSELLIDVHAGRVADVDEWRRTFAEHFPLCQHDVRDALRQFPVSPPTLHRPDYNPFEFATQVATCTNGLRVVGVRCVRREAPVADCIVERTVLSLAGHTVQSIAVRGREPSAVSRVVHQLHLDRFERRNAVEMIKQLLGIHHHAYAIANH